MPEDFLNKGYCVLCLETRTKGAVGKWIVPNRGRFDSYEPNLPLKLFYKKRKRWLTTTIFPSVPCYNRTMLKQDYCNEFFEVGQQKINISFFELCLPDDDPVYTLKKVMEELDFSGLLANCSDKGRNGYNPITVSYTHLDVYKRQVYIWCSKRSKSLQD